MFNVGGGEMLAVLLLALIVLGPDRLPKAMAEVGKVVGQLRRLSSGFQDELKKAMDTQATDDAPFRPGDEALPALAPGVEEEVRVIAGPTADATPEGAPIEGEAADGEAAEEEAHVGTSTAAEVPDGEATSADEVPGAEAQVADLPAPDLAAPDDPIPDDEDAGVGEASVTPLHPRRDDTRATG